MTVSNKKSVNDTVGTSEPENHKEVKFFPASNSCTPSQKDALVVLHRVQSPYKCSQEPKELIAKKSASHGILKFCEKSPRFQDAVIAEGTPMAKGTQRKRSLRDRKEVNYRISSDTETGSSSKDSNEYDVVCIDSDDGSEAEGNNCDLQNGTVNANESSCQQLSNFQKSKKEPATKNNQRPPYIPHTEMPSTDDIGDTGKGNSLESIST